MPRGISTAQLDHNSNVLHIFINLEMEVPYAIRYIIATNVSLDVRPQVGPGTNCSALLGNLGVSEQSKNLLRNLGNLCWEIKKKQYSVTFTSIMLQYKFLFCTCLLNTFSDNVLEIWADNKWKFQQGKLPSNLCQGLAAYSSENSPFAIIRLVPFKAPKKGWAYFCEGHGTHFYSGHTSLILSLLMGPL